MSRRYNHDRDSSTTSLSHSLSKNNISSNSTTASKKDLINEETDIGGFTLMFAEQGLEAKWNLTHLPRHISITTRYLFVATLFQIIFYLSDKIEGINNIFLFAVIRVALSLFTLLCCFCVSSGLIIPTQNTIMIINAIYGVTTLSLFHLSRKETSHWDSLFLVYGLCFFILPKISPLNFIHAFSGASLFTLLYLYVSSFRLSLQQWLLSNTLLLTVGFLFCYISYSSERVSRERWLLRQRLEREKINLRIVASSIEDDLKKAANDEGLFPALDVINNNFKTAKWLDKASSSPSSSSAMLLNQQFNSNSSSSSSSSSSSNNDSNSTNGKKMVLFFKGLAAWFVVICTGYGFQLVSIPSTPSEVTAGGLNMLQLNDINQSSAAMALLMHAFGFSVFLVYFTGQIRWLAINGLVGLTVLWILNSSGVDNKWVLFSTHSIGYVLLAVVIIVMILVFGGVVLVWSHLIDFLKDVLVRYPEVKDGLSENKLLEQVLITYISDLPQIKWNDSAPGNKQLEVYKTGDVEAESMQIYHGISSSTSGSSSSSKISSAVATTNGAMATKSSKSSKKPTGNKTGNSCNGSNSICISNDKNAKSDNISSSSTSSSSGSGSGSGSGSSSNELYRYFDQQHEQILMNPQYAHCRVIDNRRGSSYCFFCLKGASCLLIPACAGWNIPNTATTSSTGSSISMCTPYTDMVQMRDQSVHDAMAANRRNEELQHNNMILESSVKRSNDTVCALKDKVHSLDAQLCKTIKEYEEAMSIERRQRDAAMQRIINEHSHTITAMKRICKGLISKKVLPIDSIPSEDVAIFATVDACNADSPTSSVTFATIASSSDVNINSVDTHSDTCLSNDDIDSIVSLLRRELPPNPGNSIPAISSDSSHISAPFSTDGVDDSIEAINMN